MARLGGDEFTVLLEDVADAAEAFEIAERVHRAFLVPVEAKGYTLHVTTSIGIVVGNLGYERTEDVLRDADIAMYRAKALGKARSKLFDVTMQVRAAALMALEADLRAAIKAEQFEVHYQPIVRTDGARLVGFEALVRWRHPQRGLVSPGDFIPLAEETGLVIDIDRWVLQHASRQVLLWQAEFGACPPLTLSLNLSSQQFARPDLASFVADVLAETGFPAANLKLEITEGLLMDTTPQVGTALEDLRRLGVQLHIDDFGTGYSSLSYLQRFSANTLKIDRSFTNKLLESFESGELVRTIVLMAHNLGMEVVAEGVETEEQRAHLAALNCEYAQGYLFSKPLNVSAAAELLRCASKVEDVDLVVR